MAVRPFSVIATATELWARSPRMAGAAAENCKHFAGSSGASGAAAATLNFPGFAPERWRGASQPSYGPLGCGARSGLAVRRRRPYSFARDKPVRIGSPAGVVDGWSSPAGVVDGWSVELWAPATTAHRAAGDDDEDCWAGGGATRGARAGVAARQDEPSGAPRACACPGAVAHCQRAAPHTLTSMHAGATRDRRNRPMSRFARFAVMFTLLAPTCWTACDFAPRIQLACHSDADCTPGTRCDVSSGWCGCLFGGRYSACYEGAGGGWAYAVGIDGDAGPTGSAGGTCGQTDAGEGAIGDGGPGDAPPDASVGSVDPCDEDGG
jgi:hypothetical protein